ncbi:DUF1194 domain-containing protein [Rhodoblastus acidophilus]|uniref:DUF1194 domain-containing protein n=1 Tax=Candidatus Rhodoblastus alkanivorans TaxID=2954117 RepID=A0ABS9Z4I7_9HYPH|nr:DUF1194 domain-containing protein [Candidatus Rhodoblastus alkanivorans]MCI4677727.1 DUF1194 domain-containing protein [Candidatus Rhodoblastus alkanivorans]MCI4682541.1 DUF1194 domain-containing protein [Candidatus Rhodoblastus alkanivorans]MDI4639847.1 DUF1194 domain-containing protein [Rhodoblastus acidophilus]
MPPIFRLLLAGMILIAAGQGVGHAAARSADKDAPGAAPVDTALIVSVDVSGSVDQGRFALQMDGIAKALEDPEVIAAMLSGPRASMMFTMVEWSERVATAIPWTRIASRDDAFAVAARVRRTQRPAGEFTCVAHMMRYVSDLILPTLPVKAERVVMDVSGDGVDNCDEDPATARMRDALTATGMTINGLPINEGDPNEPLGGGAFRAPGRPFQPRTFAPKILEPWYRKYVIGGAGAFLLPAKGYGDFDRAIKEKFALEISAAPAVHAHFAQLGAAGSR